ncbi:MAG: hypothetical protein WBG30_06805 [Psychrilyobacter sp.]|uniref:hypothetical protein n=1 Tax=Psychrilyobacter sp. TaxID=2586924 RepID=UPI003C76A322
MMKVKIDRYTKKILYVITFLSLLLLSGCKNTGVKVKGNNNFNQISLFQIYIDSNGNLISPIDKDIIKNEERYIDNILNNYYKHKKYHKNLKLMIFIHGGLNDYNNSIDRSVNILNNNLEDMLKNGKYPIFVSWNSSFIDNYLDHVSHSKQVSNKKNILYYSLSPLIILKDILRGVTKIPKNTYNLVMKLKKKSNEKLYSKTLDSVGDNFNVSSSQIEEKNTLKSIEDNWSMANPVKIIGGAFVDTIGKGPYHSMLKRVDLLLKKNINMESSPNLYNLKKYNMTKENETALSYFLRKYKEIEKRSSNYNDKKYGKVVLIAHSMGTMVANNIISKFQDINFEEIVYMGGACSLKDIKYTISPYLESNKKSKFYNLSLNPKREVTENIGQDFIPRGSLLIYLDQTYENVNSFLDRTSGIWWNMIIAADQIFPANIRKRVTLVKFGLYNDHTKAPQCHGEFDKFKFWNKEYWKAEDQTNQNLYIYNFAKHI